MFSYFRQIKNLILFNPMFFIKALVGGLLISWIGWHFFLKRPFYQQMYGIPSVKALTIAEKDSFENIPEQPVFPITIKGNKIEIQAIKAFKTTSLVVYVDRYTPLGSWYRSLKEAKLYDKIVPQDISLATGKSGLHPECFEFSHEYRLLETSYLRKCARSFFDTAAEDISNNHSIAASENIQKGLDILKVGDVAEIEGYAVYWNGTGDLQDLRFESAVTLDQVSDQLAGGRKAGLCRQLLITKLTFDGYTFE